MKQTKYALIAVVVFIFLGSIFLLVKQNAQVRRAEEVRKSEGALKQKTQELYEAALELYRAKDYNAALAKFQEVNKLSPGNEQSLTL